jgi:uncharacterized protein (UPF0210 family)
MDFALDEIVQTLSMVAVEHFDVRTVTLGISLMDCIDSDPRVLIRKVVHKLQTTAKTLAQTVDDVSGEIGIPVANKRISVTPLSIVLASAPRGTHRELTAAIDDALVGLKVNFLGGYSALVQKGMTKGDEALIESIPEVLSTTQRICSSVNLASTKTGINMDAVARMGHVIKEAAELTKAKGGFGAAKLVVFANAPDDNPFMAGAFHGIGEAEKSLSVGVSGPGVVRQVVADHPDATIDQLAEAIKRAAFKITRVGELILKEVSQRTGIPRGIVDLSLAPTPTKGDSVANVIEAMGMERFGGPGSTAALALLNEAMKRGGAMASTHVGGLSGAFVPVAEDQGMAEAAQVGALTIEKLEALTAVCSVGLDMVVVPGDTPPETISAIIADEAAIGVVNNKTTAVRIIPVPGGKAGEWVDYGGLFGSSPIMAVSPFSPKKFIQRGGWLPAPLRGLTN